MCIVNKIKNEIWNVSTINILNDAQYNKFDFIQKMYFWYNSQNLKCTKHVPFSELLELQTFKINYVGTRIQNKLEITFLTISYFIKHKTLTKEKTKNVLMLIYGLVGVNPWQIIIF